MEYRRPKGTIRNAVDRLPVRHRHARSRTGSLPFDFWPMMMASIRITAQKIGEFAGQRWPNSYFQTVIPDSCEPHGMSRTNNV